MRDNEHNNNVIIKNRLTTPKNRVVISLLGMIINCEQMLGYINVCHVYNAATSTIQKWCSKNENGKIR